MESRKSNAELLRHQMAIYFTSLVPRPFTIYKRTRKRMRERGREGSVFVCACAYNVKGLGTRLILYVLAVCVFAKRLREAACVYFPRVPGICRERRSRNVYMHVLCIELYSRTYIQRIFGV